MLFSIVGEIGLIVIGLAYVLDCWFDSFINMIEVTSKNSDEKDKEKELPDSIKHMYS